MDSYGEAIGEVVWSTEMPREYWRDHLRRDPFVVWFAEEADDAPLAPRPRRNSKHRQETDDGD